MTTNYPDAVVFNYGSKWHVPLCPHCGGQHTHPRDVFKHYTSRYIGQRQSPCGGGVYVLLEVADPGETDLQEALKSLINEERDQRELERLK